jgi:DNA repair protein RadD
MLGHNGGPAFQDRPYQTDAVEAIWDYFRKGGVGNPLVAMPTGTGKSVVIARFLQSVFRAYPMQRVMLLTHVKELIQQNYEKLLMLWDFAPAGIYSAGLGQRDTSCPITFAGIASVWKLWKLFGHIDLVLIDEAHLLSPNDQTMYRQFLIGLQSINPNLKVIGLTATPWRLGHGHLCDASVDKNDNEIPPLFNDVCFDLTTLSAFNKLIDDGYLVPLVPKPTKVEFDTQGLHTRGGDFIEKEMQERFDKEEITEEALKEAMTIAEEHGLKKWLIFASGTDHADNVGDMLTMLGVSNRVVHSKRAGRDESIAMFKRGEITALVNNNVLTTGFDDPQIDLIVVLRATQSSVLWVQMLGRGTRPYYVGKHDLNTLEGRYAAIAEGGKLFCMVLDYARNTSRLGPVNDPVIPGQKGKGGGAAPVKLCEVCETFNHASVRFCGGFPYKTPLGCGSEFSFEVKFKTEASTDDLIKIDEPKVKVFRIDHISVDLHEKHDAPPMMKVSYYCGFKNYTDFVCIEHANYAGRKAKQWWKERTDLPFPASTIEAIDLVQQLKPATHLRVWTNKKPYPEIMGYCYDGTAFGTEQVQEDWQAPQVENRAQRELDSRSKNTNYDDLDDDIPF